MSDTTQYVLVLIPSEGVTGTFLGFFNSQEDAENSSRAQAQVLLNDQWKEFHIHKVSPDTLVTTRSKTDFADTYASLAESLGNQLQNTQHQLEVVQGAISGETETTPSPDTSAPQTTQA